MFRLTVSQASLDFYSFSYRECIAEISTLYILSSEKSDSRGLGAKIKGSYNFKMDYNNARREFFREILYNNIAIISIQHSKINFFDTFGDFSHTVE